MANGLLPVLTVVEPVKPPAPSPKRMETEALLLLAMAKSCLPSLLKSPTAGPYGEPTLMLGALEKTGVVAQAVPLCTVSVKVLLAEPPGPKTVTVTVKVPAGCALMTLTMP